MILLHILFIILIVVETAILHLSFTGDILKDYNKDIIINIIIDNYINCRTAAFTVPP